MMQEIFQRGPISAGIADPALLKTYKAEDGVYCDETDDHTVTHVVSIVGYGVLDGTNYWLVRNSWGHEYGDQGFFKVCRGVNNIDIESNASWATPKDTWTEPVYHYTT